MKIEEIEKSIVEDFELFDEWAEKYQYIIELGQKLPPLDDKYKIEENKIKGCQSSETDLKFIDEIGLRQHIAVTRANGLASMIKQMKLYALGLNSKQSA